MSRRAVRRSGRVATVLGVVLVACTTGAPSLPPPAPGGTAAEDAPTSPATPGPAIRSPTPRPTVAATPSAIPRPSATAAPPWLGTRPLEPGPTGYPPPQPTPDVLLPRSIATADVLPPPPSGAFVATVATVTDEVAARSTWHAGCPVARTDLRHLTVSFVGFDGGHHTGEVLLHADAVEAVVAIFEAMHRARFPLEEVAIITPADLDAPATGDGNTTSAFVCRPARGSDAWSEHAHGRALDINPFHNPYVRDTGKGRVVLPELATAYADRSRGLPGMLVDGDPVVAAVADAGWQWGGHYTSVSDPMHVSATGR